MIFLSHSSTDAATAMEICELLEQNRIECFIAPRNIRSGREYAEEIVNGIDSSTVMVLLMSEAANASPHVLREVERAVSKNIPILVYKLENVELSKSLEYFLMTHQWINKENRRDYSEILKAVRELAQESDDAGILKAAQLQGTEVNKQETAENRQRTTGNRQKTTENRQNTTKNPKIMVENSQRMTENLQKAAEVPSGKEKNSGTDVKKPRHIKWVYIVCAALAAATVGLVLNTAGLFSPGNNASASEEYDIQVGDSLVFGSYNNEPIQWRVLRLEEQDGKQTAVLISRYILTMKAFDAAESGKYNHDENRDYISRESEADSDMELQAYVRGNSSWQKSNIRTWLNAETEIVAYEGQAPVSSAMSELHNGYQNEPGFLYNFTEEEIGMLVERECHTPGNALEDGDIITCDRVFLLSKEELDWFDEAGISKLSEPTAAALEQDKSQWYEVSVSEYGLTEYCWWLRTPVEGYSSKAYLVENGYGIENAEINSNLKKANVGLEGFGIRPALTIDLESYFEYQNR
ncbi:MAG: toll/interleukin-1 receptor domain-containing protein [Acetatifactor sp.]|nr:toll/interleukin-1 receptor domain-containing protein [Acetatifactor sp.]